jgi:hypothetical protein
MTTFCKHENCPSSAELLDFQHGELTRAHGSVISAHLETCDFCAAEVEFYFHYPLDKNSDESVQQVEIPGPLYELAEALLKKKHTDARSLNSLLKEKGKVIAGKA